MRNRGLCIRLAVAAVLGGCLLAMPGAALADDLPQIPVAHPQLPPATQLIVGFKKGVSSGEQGKIVSRLKGSRKMKFGRIRASVVKPRSGMGLDRLRQALRRNPNVSYAEPDQSVGISKAPDDPLAIVQYQYGLTGRQTANIEATNAWNTLTKCAKVAVLDTGVDTGHPDLKDNLWKNSKETPNNGKDDDGNGYVDDYYGVDIVDRHGDGQDLNGHGTHVAGTIGGRGNNGTGISGVCWSTKLMSVRVMNANGSGTMSNVISGLDYALDHSARVVNMSLGSSTKSKAFEDAIKEAQDAGTLIVVAAGNDSKDVDGSPDYPCAYTESNVLCIAASDSGDQLASFSNFGHKAVDLAAPGDSIVATYLDSSYAILSGTSMSTPIVTGTAALLHKRNSDATYKDIRNAIRKSVDKLSPFTDTTYSGGRLDVGAALTKFDSS